MAPVTAQLMMTFPLSFGIYSSYPELASEGHQVVLHYHRHGECGKAASMNDPGLTPESTCPFFITLQSIQVKRHFNHGEHFCDD
jgi:hypothetical protein